MVVSGMLTTVRPSEATMGKASVFLLRFGALWHREGDTDCMACDEPPTRCSNPDCTGMVHREQCADGDTYGTHLWVESGCDGCGERLRREEWSEEKVADYRMTVANNRRKQRAVAVRRNEEIRRSAPNIRSGYGERAA